MIPDISEFSYGFALTRELIELADPPLLIAPVFPSLIQEGRKGGGYDVNLAIPGFPLFLQFKRSECMKRASAREAALIPLPYYRMRITERRRSAQHEMLLALDAGPYEVFYAAPTFHTVEELNAAYRTNSVSSRSCYVRPAKIGKLDGEAHYVAFNSQRFLRCSEPHEISGVSGTLLPYELEQRLRAEQDAFGGEPLTAALNFVSGILVDHKLAVDSFAGSTDVDPGFRLQRLADLTLNFFNAQIFIVQRRMG